MIFIIFLGYILIRFSLYFPSYDDLSYHLLAGTYAPSIFMDYAYMPLDMYTYSFPIIHVLFTPLINFFGFRLTLLFLYLFAGCWATLIANKLCRLLEGKIPKLLIHTAFLLLFFVPSLVGTYMTFMIDIWSLLLAINGFILVKLSKSKMASLGLGMLVLSTMIKPSIGIFILPLCLLLIYKNRAKLRSIISLLFIILAVGYWGFVWYKTGNPTPGLMNKIFQSPLYPITNFDDNRWGPNGLFETIIWPIWGTWTTRFHELTLPYYSKIYISLIAALLWGGNIILFVTRKNVYSLFIIGGYIIWAVISGYSRYSLPLDGLALVNLLTEVAIPAKLNNLTKPLAVFAIVLAISSFKSDFSWRPYPSFKNRESNIYFTQMYREGLTYVAKDTLPALANNTKKVWQDGDAILLSGKGQAVFVSGLGYLNGIPIISYAESDKFHRIVILSEYHLDDQYIRNLYPLRTCAKLDLKIEIPMLQNISFSDTTMYECVNSLE